MSCSSWVCTLGYSSVTLILENPSQNQVFWGRESARKRRKERDCLGCPGWVSSSSVVLKGKTVFNLTSAHFHLPWHVKPLWEQKDKFYKHISNILPQARASPFLRWKSLSGSPHLSLLFLLRRKWNNGSLSVAGHNYAWASTDDHEAWRHDRYCVCWVQSYVWVLSKSGNPGLYQI